MLISQVSCLFCACKGLSVHAVLPAPCFLYRMHHVQKHKRGHAPPQEREKAAGVKHEVGGRVVLDDISWDTIARQHGSRSEDQCKLKWYTSLSPSMVSRGAPSSSCAWNRGPPSIRMQLCSLSGFKRP